MTSSDLFQSVVYTLPPSSVETFTHALNGPSFTVTNDTCIEKVVYSSKPLNSDWKVLLVVGACRRRLLCRRSAVYFLTVAFVSPTLK